MTVLRALVLVAFCLLLAVGHATASLFDEGVAAFDKRDYEAAFRLWLPLAQQGHAGAQFNVAVLYEKGQGVAQDAAEAAKWYRKAAEQGDVQAQYSVGMLYENGTGIARDPDEARKWYRIVMANPATDPDTVKVKQRARTRLAGLTTATETLVPYAGGRYAIARGSDDVCIVALQGAITRPGVDSFDEVIRKSAELGCRNPWLMLESPGGLLFESLDLGLKIRKAGFRTIARSSCASACAILFMAGVERTLVGSTARIGLHQPARGTVCDPTSYTSAARDTAEYLHSVIPAHADEIMALILRTSCKEIDWVSGQRALDLQVATDLEWQGVAMRAPRPVAQPAR